MDKRRLLRKEQRKKLAAWNQLVKQRDKACVVCGSTKMLNAHHIVVQEVEALRFDVQNGIALCPLHHQFSRQMSAHGNSFPFFVWLKKNRPEQYAYLEEKCALLGETHSVETEVAA